MASPETGSANRPLWHRPPDISASSYCQRHSPPAPHMQTLGDELTQDADMRSRAKRHEFARPARNTTPDIGRQPPLLNGRRGR